jgi:hypothetical protein
LKTEKNFRSLRQTKIKKLGMNMKVSKTWGAENVGIYEIDKTANGGQPWTMVISAKRRHLW